MGRAYGQREGRRNVRSRIISIVSGPGRSCRHSVALRLRRRSLPCRERPMGPGQWGAARAFSGLNESMGFSRP